MLSLLSLVRSRLHPWIYRRTLHYDALHHLLDDLQCSLPLDAALAHALSSCRKVTTALVELLDAESEHAILHRPD